MDQDTEDQDTEITRDVVTRVMTAWAKRDLQAVAATLASDVIHTINLDGSLAVFARSVDGKPEVVQKLQSILDTFDFQSYDVVSIEPNGTAAAVRVDGAFLHRISGQLLKTHFRLIFEQRDGKIITIEEYHDAGYFTAFLRLFHPQPNSKPETAVTHAIVRHALSAWSTRNFDATLACCAPDVQHIAYLGTEKPTKMKRSRGTQMLRQIIEDVGQKHKSHNVEFLSLEAEGMTATVHMKAVYQETGSDRLITFQRHLTFKQHNGLIVSIEDQPVKE